MTLSWSLSNEEPIISNNMQEPTEGNFCCHEQPHLHQHGAQQEEHPRHQHCLHVHQGDILSFQNNKFKEENDKFACQDKIAVICLVYGPNKIPTPVSDTVY